MSEQSSVLSGTNRGHSELISSSEHKSQPLFLYGIGLLASSAYLIHRTISADTYTHIITIIALIILSTLLMSFNVQIAITRTRILFSLIVHLSLVLGWCYCVDADWIVAVCVVIWYLCAWCLSVFNRQVPNRKDKGKTQ